MFGFAEDFFAEGEEIKKEVKDVKTAKFWCAGCHRGVFSKDSLKHGQKIRCPHCGIMNEVTKENGKVKAKISL